MAQNNTPFPIKYKQTARTINGVFTEMITFGFSNKIVVIISQFGKIGSLLHTTLASPPSSEFSSVEVSSEPVANTQFLLGANTEPIYQIYASQVSTNISLMRPTESRPVLLGLALKNPSEDKYLFDQVIDMLKQCPVW
ncbi:hypothetical protein K7432_003070 [Basidiobolus ranarum]|uniref:Proteasome assembly chaperone 3 n=1 Tax=Basidiobolus ranarum TaxID=34480 RepID=A0ABR2W6Q6_9FUNG